MEEVNLQTRKPVTELNVDDFATFPVWEYADDEEGAEDRDETWVRPVDTTIVPKRSYTHVAADFATACGKQLAGFVTVSTLDGSPEACQGVVFHDGVFLFVSNPGAFGFNESRKHLLSALGLSEPEVFPLSFRLKVAMADQPNYSGGVLA